MMEVELSEQEHFRRLFQAILNEIIESHQVEEEDIGEAIYEMMEAFKRFQFLDMSQWNYLCAYVFRYAPHGAGLTRNRMSEVIQNFADLEPILNRNDLQIVSLGGGPGNDVIGFCSALFQLRPRNNENLLITVVDQYREWSACVTLAQNLISEHNFGNVSLLFNENHVQMTFLQVNLPGDPMQDRDYFERLQSADVIIMAKLFSLMRFPRIHSVLRSLRDNVKSEAVILYIDPTIIPDVADYFDILYESPEDQRYEYPAGHERFGYDDGVGSRARIAVLRKQLQN